MRKAIIIITALITLLVALNFGSLAVQYWDQEPVGNSQQPITDISSTELLPS